jgi:hypothetical protein
MDPDPTPDPDPDPPITKQKSKKNLDQHPDPDPLVRGVDPRIQIRIWIHPKMSWIRNTDIGNFMYMSLLAAVL